MNQNQNEEKLSYLVQRLPDFFKTELQTERNATCQKLIKDLEKALINNDLELLNEIPFQFEICQRIFGFKKEEKQHVFLLVANFLGQPYFYLTKNGVRNQLFQQFQWILQITRHGFEEGSVEVDWKHLFNMMNQIFLDNRNNLYVNVEADKIIHFKRFLSYLEVMRQFFTEKSIDEVFQKSQEKLFFVGLVTLKQYLRITHKIPGNAYWPLVKNLVQLLQLRTFRYHEEYLQYLIYVIIARHPQLPWHEYYDQIFSMFYRELIQILPMKDNKAGYQTKQTQFSSYNKFPGSPKVIGYTLANLLLPTTHKYFDQIWEQVSRIFGMLRVFIHPNNQQIASFKYLSIYYYFLAQVVHRLSRNKRKEKPKEQEIELHEMLSQEENEEQNQNIEEEASDLGEDDEEKDLQDQLVENEDIQLNDAVIEKVIEIYMNDVQNILYLKDSKDKLIQELIYLLVALKPNQITKTLMDIIFRALQRNDMKFTTINGVLYAMLPTLLDRKECPDGLYLLPNILRSLSSQMNAHDAHQAYAIWRFFDNVLQFIPVYDIDDLKKDCNDLDEKMSVEDQQFTEEISSIVLEAFRRYLGLFEYLGKSKSKLMKQFRTLSISISNKFYNVISNCSRSILKELFRVSAEYMQEKIQPQVQQYFAQLLQAFTQRDPQQALKTFFPIISEKILKRQTPTDVKHMKFLSPVRYDFNVTHQPTLLYYLSLTEELVGFSHYHCRMFDDQIQAIIQLSLQHEEIQVFNEGLKIAQQLFLGLVSTFPQDLSFRDDSNYDLQWMQNTSKQFKKSFKVDWYQPTAEDRKYLLELMNKFFYPIMNYLLEFIVKQNTQVDDLMKYIKENFYQIICQLNEPLSSQNLQIDLQTRNELYRALRVVQALFSSIQYKCYESPCNETVRKFQEWNSFVELKGEYEKVDSLVRQFFPVLVQCGLSSDQRIVTTYLTLLQRFLGRHVPDDYNQHLIQIRKWIYGRALMFKNPVTKRTVLSRFIRVILANYQLNLRILAIGFLQEQVSDEHIALIVCLGFQTDCMKTCYRLLTSIGNDKQNLIEVIDGSMQRLYQSELFSVDAHQKMDQNTLQKYGMFQKLVIQVTMKFMEYQNSLPEMKLNQQDLLINLNKAYHSLIDKTFKNQYNLILVKFLELGFRQTLKYSQQRITDNISFIKHSYDNCNLIWQERIQTVKLNQNQEEKLYGFIKDLVENTVKIMQSQDTPVRSRIVHGLVLLFTPPAILQDNMSHIQLNDRVYNIALDSLVSNEFAMRSYGRILLFRLIRIVKNINSKDVELSYTKEDFKEQKTFKKFLETRFYRTEDINKLMVKNASKLGVYTYYTELKYGDIQFSDIKQSLQTILKAFDNKDFCHQVIQKILNDMQANEDNQGIFYQQGIDYSSMFHDVSKYFNQQLNANLKRDNLFYKNYTVQYEYLKRLFKKLFQITDYKLFFNSKDYIQQLSAQHNDKDNQMLTRLYILGLLKAVHSKWPVPENIQKSQIIDFALNIIGQNIETAARDQFFQIQVGLMMVCFDTDSRQLSYLVDKLVEKTKEQTQEIRIIRYINLITSIHKCSGFRGFRFSQQIWDCVKPILEQSKDSRVIQAIVNLYIAQIKDVYNVPTNKKLIFQLYNIEKLPLTYFDIENTDYSLEFVNQFQELMNFVCKLLRDQTLETRKLAYDSVPYLVELTKHEIITLRQLDYYGDFFKYLLQFKEEDIQNEQISQQFSDCVLIISQLIYDQDAFNVIINYVREGCNSSFFKTRIRSLRSLMFLLYNNIQTNRLQYLKEFSYLLGDEQKLVSEQAKNLVGTLSLTLLPQELEELVEFYIQLTVVKDTELQGKMGLIGLITAQQYMIQSWTNRALKYVLQGRSKSGQIKDFAAHFQKMQKGNFLYEESVYPLDIEIVEKLSEYASPYNYFA